MFISTCFSNKWNNCLFLEYNMSVGLSNTKILTEARFWPHSNVYLWVKVFWRNCLDFLINLNSPREIYENRSESQDLDSVNIKIIRLGTMISSKLTVTVTLKLKIFNLSIFKKKIHTSKTFQRLYAFKSGYAGFPRLPVFRWKKISYKKLSILKNWIFSIRVL